MVHNRYTVVVRTIHTPILIVIVLHGYFRGKKKTDCINKIDKKKKKIQNYILAISIRLPSQFSAEPSRPLSPYLFVIALYITIHPTPRSLKTHLVHRHVCNVCFSVRYFTRNNLDMCIRGHPINLPPLKFFISVGRKGTISKPSLKRILMYIP